MGVIRADIHALMSAKFLETRPEIGLQILHQMTEMDIPIRIGESACYYNLPFFRHICLLPLNETTIIPQLPHYRTKDARITILCVLAKKVENAGRELCIVLQLVFLLMHIWNN